MGTTVDIEHCTEMRNMTKHEKWQKLDIEPCYFDVTIFQATKCTLKVKVLRQHRSPPNASIIELWQFFPDPDPDHDLERTPGSG